MTFPIRPLWLALSSLSLIACSAQAADDADAVKKAFSRQFPDRQVVSVAPTSMKGVFEVVMQGRQIVYTDARAEHLLVGELIDVKKKESLTEKRMNQLSRVDWNSLPLDLAIKEVRGQGSRKLVVFSDPDCPFCKKLETTLAQLDDVTIHTFLFPLAELHPDAPRKSAQIWCASNRTEAWVQLMRNGVAPQQGAASCDTPLAKLQELGQKLGISGTPALVFPNGQLVSGAIPKTDVEKLLNSK